jgi:two-component system NtrC family sensor kinase
VHTVDIAQEPAYAEVFKVNPWLRQVHSNLVVPLLKDGELIGVFILFRGQVRPFIGKEVALVQNFAARAVIAMENARLLNEIRQRQAELRVTFDNMVDGVAMFDAELRLAAWNRNFQELLDLSESFLAESPGFDEYVRYLTERGEFGESDPETEIKRLRERLREKYHFERTRPDGTVIEVRHNPMPEEPAQLRQQFRRALGRVARRIEGDRRPGDYCAGRRPPCRGRRDDRDAHRQS